MENVVQIERKRITVYGVVQGVGFRPFVYRLAHEHGLNGWVLNHSGGVDIEVEGPVPAIAAFLADLTAKAPPLSRIEGLVAEALPPNGYTRFEIRHSVSREDDYQLVSPDMATCPDCLRELFDPSDRRYRYPFTNCTNCGPRFTIIESVPYDRSRTTMRNFEMCPACQREYEDPLDRRFHAQPNACPVCGPQLELRNACGEPIQCYDVLAQAAKLLSAGHILALKGLGGFHLTCDATNAAAVGSLRERKRRPAKPFAVMMATLSEVEAHCVLNDAERRLLTSPECPIVLLPWRAESSVAPNVAPAQHYLGVMLPYTPLHHILLRDIGRPLVMTSGNLTEEPIACENEEALARLGKLADYFVLHNRGIYARYDDSVWFVPSLPDGESRPFRPTPQPIRRARGYAPYPIHLPFNLPSVLAAGAELKNTFCLTRGPHAFLSQHIGDMENLETFEHFEQTIALYERLFRAQPQVIAYDLHLDYMATRYARERQERSKLPAIGVQHHHAHLAACLGDNAWPANGGPVIGVCFDGTGLGLDGHIWGGEFLIADYHRAERIAHLEYMPLPGGDAAIRNPTRLAIGYLNALFGESAVNAFAPHLRLQEPQLIPWIIRSASLSPLTSSVGRLFDAVSALLGICPTVTYEAQAAMELEMHATGLDIRRATPRYHFDVCEEGQTLIISLRNAFEGILADLSTQRDTAEIALDFHASMAKMIAEVCETIAARTSLRTVALTGGCFQNRLLIQMAAEFLATNGFRVLVHHQVPCNDGGVSLGQAIIAGLAVAATQ